MVENKRCICIEQWRTFVKDETASFYIGTDGNNNKVLFVGGFIIYKSEFNKHFKLFK